MKNRLLLIFTVLLAGYAGRAQEMSKFHLYNPAENAAEALTKIIKNAKDTRKHVFVQIGGNWCVWCAWFNDLITKDPQIDSLIHASYIVYHLNYSPENRNKELLAKFEYPQRFGFPVFIILDGDGKRLHTQNSAYLEEGKGYNREKVMEFFQQWSPKALDPEQYKNY
jgi:thioredoxin-related protein